MTDPRQLALTGLAVAFLIATALVLSGSVPAPASLDAIVPWIGFGGAFLLFILAIRSRKT